VYLFGMPTSEGGIHVTNDELHENTVQAVRDLAALLKEKGDADPRTHKVLDNTIREVRLWVEDKLLPCLAEQIAAREKAGQPFIDRASAHVVLMRWVKNSTAAASNSLWSTQALSVLSYCLDGLRQMLFTANDTPAHQIPRHGTSSDPDAGVVLHTEATGARLNDTGRREAIAPHPPS